MGGIVCRGIVYLEYAAGRAPVCGGYVGGPWPHSRAKPLVNEDDDEERNEFWERVPKELSRRYGWSCVPGNRIPRVHEW